MPRGKQIKMFKEIQMGFSESHESRATLEKLSDVTGLQWTSISYTPAARSEGNKEITDYLTLLPNRVDMYALEDILSHHGLQPEVVVDVDESSILLSQKNASKLIQDRSLQRTIQTELKTAGLSSSIYRA